MIAQRRVYFNDLQHQSSLIFQSPSASLKGITRSPRAIHQSHHSPVIQSGSHSSRMIILIDVSSSPASSTLPPTSLLYQGTKAPDVRWLLESATKKCRRISITTTALMSYRNQFQCYSATMQYTDGDISETFSFLNLSEDVQLSSIPIKTYSYKHHPLR